MKRTTIKAKDIHSTLEKHMLVDGFHLAVDLEKSHGSWLYDALKEREILDFYSYFASLPIGHNHTKLEEDEEFLLSLKRAAIANPSNSDIYTSQLAAFVDTFAHLAKPKEFSHLFFIAGGALAVENALKAAFDWKTRTNINHGLKESGTKVIHFEEAFHGRSGYTLSLTNTDPVKTEYFPKFDWPRIKNPKLHFPLSPSSLKKTIDVEREALGQISRAFEQFPNEIAAIIIEPIQGEGGDNHFRGEFLRELRRIADEKEVILIFDEVQTGLGLTGKMWAYQHFGAVPDIVAFGKKTQVCGIMATSRLDQPAGGVFEKSSRINSTWGGNLCDMVRSQKYLEIINEEKLIKNAHLMGERFLEGLETLAKEFDAVTNARGRGLFTAFTLPDAAIRNKVREKCWALGLATLASWPHSLRFRPCLNVSEEEIDLALSILRDALKAVFSINDTCQ